MRRCGCAQNTYMHNPHSKTWRTSHHFWNVCAFISLCIFTQHSCARIVHYSKYIQIANACRAHAFAARVILSHTRDVLRMHFAKVRCLSPHHIVRIIYLRGVTGAAGEGHPRNTNDHRVFHNSQLTFRDVHMRMEPRKPTQMIARLLLQTLSAQCNLCEHVSRMHIYNHTYVGKTHCSTPSSKQAAHDLWPFIEIND